MTSLSFKFLGKNKQDDARSPTTRVSWPPPPRRRSSRRFERCRRCRGDVFIVARDGGAGHRASSSQVEIDRDRNRRRRSRRLPAPSPEPRASVRGAFRVSRSRECHLRGRRREREDDDGAALRRRRAGDQVLVPDVQRATEASRAQARGRARPREPGGALLPRARGEVLRGTTAGKTRRCGGSWTAISRRGTARPRSNCLVVDEAQDLTPLLHRLVLKAIRDRDASSSGATPASLLILGDSRQSIYQFRDADSRFLTFADRGLYRPATADADETENDESETDAAAPPPAAAAVASAHAPHVLPRDASDRVVRERRHARVPVHHAVAASGGPRHARRVYGRRRVRDARRARGPRSTTSSPRRDTRTMTYSS